MSLEALLKKCEGFLARSTPADAAHDLSHVKRVVRNCVQLTEIESADAFVTLPSAWLHDCVAVAKDSPLRAQGSRLAAEAATGFLAESGRPR